MNNKPLNILVVDDEEDLCEILQFNLKNEGFAVDVAYSAEDSLKKDLKHYELFILDVMMGAMSGFRLAEYIRKDLKLATPIIFLTAKDDENDILTGFTLGADDYISKPFSIKELVARVKAIARRSAAVRDQLPGPLVVEDLELDVVKKRLVVAGSKIELTPKEFEILYLLWTNQGRIFSREDIMDRVWSDDVVVNERAVDVNVTRLRKKMGAHGRFLKNKTGYGYYIEFA